jgi:hypothetical protein
VITDPVEFNKKLYEAEMARVTKDLKSSGLDEATIIKVIQNVEEQFNILFSDKLLSEVANDKAE